MSSEEGPRLLTVGIADMQVVGDSGIRLITYALGSCLGIAIHDARAQVSGLLHVMLPDSRIDEQRVNRRPLMFVDTAVPLLFRAAYRLGARKERIVLKVAGGASPFDRNGRFDIGRRNYGMLRRLLWKNGVAIAAADVGGEHYRTMSIDSGDGSVRVLAREEVKPL